MGDYDMRGKYDFREPLMAEDNGLYITAAQMQFFLNRPKGEEMFANAEEEFIKYYKNCCLYNIVYDMMDDDERCATMYWDATNESVALSFNIHGPVAKELAKFAKISDEDDYDEPDHPFGIIE
jgi:hypothetical protein